MARRTTKEQIDYLSAQEQRSNAMQDQEIKNFNEMTSQDKQKAAFAKLSDILQLINLEKTRTYTTSTYSKDSLRSYLKSPATESNQKSLRKLSDYLYTISHIYRRMVNYKAEQIECMSWVAYPHTTISEDNDVDNIKQNYDKICKIVHNMHMESQIQKMMLRAWKYDCAFGYIYGDPEKDGTFYIHPLDNDYCRVFSASYNQGVLGMAFDMSYFQTYPDDLEYYDSEFQKLYTQYQKDNIRWKELPIEKTFVIKINSDNLNYPIPPFSGILEDIINLEDLSAIQSVADELDAYKLIWMKIDTISGSKDPDDFSVDLNLAQKFYSKISPIIPDGVNLALSPLDLNTIDFKSNAAADDTTTLNKAYQQVIESNGSIVLNSNRITNSEAFKKAMMVECIDAMKPVSQINSWINLYLINNYKITDWTVEYSNVSPYFVEDRLKTLKEAGQYGLPTKLEYASLLKTTPLKERGMAVMEDILGLGSTQWNHPLVSSNTQSSADLGVDQDTGGAPVKDSTDISSDGVASRDKQ